jgi:hypothetical protein
MMNIHNYGPVVQSIYKRSSRIHQQRRKENWHRSLSPHEMIFCMEGTGTNITGAIATGTEVPVVICVV